MHVFSVLNRMNRLLLLKKQGADTQNPVCQHPVYVISRFSQYVMAQGFHAEYPTLDPTLTLR